MLNNEDSASLERATLDAVAPPEIQEATDWLLPLDRSTIGRAKSAVPLRHEGLAADALDGIEAAYHDWGIDAQFRVADVPGLSPIHQRLRAMGYAPEQPTLVQVGTISALLAIPAGATATVDTYPNARLASVYTAPGFDAVKVVRHWVGHYAYNTLDQNAILGPHPEVPNLLFMNGFSGHGLQQSPAIGRGVAEHLLTGAWQSLDLSDLSIDRVISGKPFSEKHVV